MMNIPFAINLVPLSIVLMGHVEACEKYEEEKKINLPKSLTIIHKQQRKSREDSSTEFLSLMKTEWESSTVIAGRGGYSRTYAFVRLRWLEKHKLVERMGSKVNTLWRRK